jgi:hypothetical protein
LVLGFSQRVISKLPFASFNNSHERLLGVLLKYVCDHNRVAIDTIDDPPDFFDLRYKGAIEQGIKNRQSCYSNDA